MTRRNFLATAAAAVASSALPAALPMTVTATTPQWIGGIDFGGGPDRGGIVKGTRNECTGEWTWTIIDPRDFYQPFRLAESACP